MKHKNIPYRRWQEYLHNKKLKEISEYCGYPGVWYKREQFFVSCRPRSSKWVKKQSNKAIRRKHEFNQSAFRGGIYKRCYDYWWTIT